MEIVFLSEGRVHVISGSGSNANVRKLECSVAEKYRERAREIRQKNEWKHTGSGAAFMGSSMFTGDFMGGEPQDIRLFVTGVARENDRLVYALNFEDGGGVYFTYPDASEQDTHLYVDTKTSFYELDVNKSGVVAVSCATNHVERHIALLSTTKNDFRTLTDGDCSDCNPRWSRKNESVLYYDSAGIGYTSEGYFAGFGPRSVYRLNVKTGELDEVLQNADYDYVSPSEDAQGNLYFIRRPFKQPVHRMSLADTLLAPFRFLRAIGGWMDFFSRKYTGKPLNTAGANPAKQVQKSPQQIFIDGNLLEAEKNLKMNAAAGEANPGYAPRSWELVKKTPDGSETVLHKGVMGYCITDNGVAYSNGKYVISDNDTVSAHLAGKLNS